MPVCSACSRRRTTCTYSEVDRRRGKLKKNETDALQERIKTLEDVVSILSLGSGDDARDLLRAMRANASSSTSDGGPTLAEVLSEWQRFREQDVEHTAEVSWVLREGAMRKEMQLSWSPDG
jgi:hypothetical protein